jgi:hypothetical protein
MTDVKILYPKLSLLEQEVIDMLCTLNANKAVGPDIKTVVSPVSLSY